MAPLSKFAYSPSVSCDTVDCDECLSISDLTPIFFDDAEVSYSAAQPLSRPKVSAMSTHCALCGVLLRLRATRVAVPSQLITQMSRRTTTISALAKEQDCLITWLKEIEGELRERVFGEMLTSPGIDEEWRRRLKEIE